MKKSVLTVLISFLVVSLFVGVWAESLTRVEVRLDPGKNVLIRLMDVSTGAVFDTPKITNYGTGAAVTEFQTSRESVNLLILITKNGEVVEDVVMGPYETGGLIEIDVRSNKPESKELIEKVSSDDEELVEEAAVEDNNTNGTAAVVDDGVEEDVVTGKDLTGNSGDITGKSVFYNKFHDEDGSLKLLYPILASLLFVFFLVGIVFMISKRKGRGHSDELSKIQKQIEKRSREIRLIKQARAYKSRVNQAKMELEREEEVLKSLEGQDPGEYKAKLDQARIELARKERILDSLRTEENKNKSN